MKPKFVYSFGNGKAEGNMSMRSLLGGKGSNLAEMCLLGISVPYGFTITTEVCQHFNTNSKQFPDSLMAEVDEALNHMEDSLSLKFGDYTNPLLVSVRSGARASMPGMMDTILNLGLNDKTVEGLLIKTNNPKFAYDSYRRFIQMYGDVVLGVERHYFEELLYNKKQECSVKVDNDLPIEALTELIEEFKQKILEETHIPFPQDVREQLWHSIKAVFNSWMNPRAITYRRLHNIPEEWGTAVNIQSMVFGNFGTSSATGVAFTRNPNNGENYLYGEYLVDAQGEDVVAGIRTPQTINTLGQLTNECPYPSMEEHMPQVYQELCNIYKKLESHYRDMQDIEFTVENNKLWILQTRSGKRTAQAAVNIAVDLVTEGLITEEEAINRIEPSSLDKLLHPTLDPKAKYQVIDKGLPASPGAASGVVVFSAEDAEKKASNNEKVILVRIETSPEDISGMFAAEGILTCRGGMTSHAAVVARGMGKSCITGASNIIIDYNNKSFFTAQHKINEGDYITINGSTGEVILGSVPTIQPLLSEKFEILMQWADKIRTMEVRANAETILDASVARKFGAEGIGLCRTEHMFFDSDRINLVRSMILADGLEQRKNALNKLLPYQRKDFVELFKIMNGYPINIRLLDPPLHEFLPHTEEEIQEVAEIIGISVNSIKYRIIQLRESNPMLGHRGCRLGISCPEIYEMQSLAIFEAMAELKVIGMQPIAEIMIPLIATSQELEILRRTIQRIAEIVEDKTNVKLIYQVGTMIELPRAAIVADQIAPFADYFSFGTNDLTQTTFGISRDDAASFLGSYQNLDILPNDPFSRLDEEGVGEIIRIAVEKGRSTKPNLKLGVCGEHGGDPKSIDFFQKVGLNYISCSPYRIPIARIAAAQAFLKQKKR
jgi:pyruvate,orthophosphate dikinase